MCFDGVIKLPIFAWLEALTGGHGAVRRGPADGALRVGARFRADSPASLAEGWVTAAAPVRSLNPTDDGANPREQRRLPA